MRAIEAAVLVACHVIIGLVFGIAFMVAGLVVLGFLPFI